MTSWNLHENVVGGNEEKWKGRKKGCGLNEVCLHPVISDVPDVNSGKKTESCLEDYIETCFDL